MDAERQKLVDRLAAILDPDAFSPFTRMSPVGEHVTWQTSQEDWSPDWEKRRRADMARAQAHAYLDLANDIITAAIRTPSPASSE